MKPFYTAAYIAPLSFGVLLALLAVIGTCFLFLGQAPPTSVLVATVVGGILGGILVPPAVSYLSRKFGGPTSTPTPPMPVDPNVALLLDEKCPACKAGITHFFVGPSGGASQNVTLYPCEHEVNIYYGGGRMIGAHVI